MKFDRAKTRHVAPSIPWGYFLCWIPGSLLSSIFACRSSPSLLLR
ncbi:hypothetical protein WG66_003404, partial [Moniliophthora roreri]